jgi:hypothetical protein
VLAGTDGYGDLAFHQRSAQKMIATQARIERPST